MIKTQKIAPNDARILAVVYGLTSTPTIPQLSMMHAVMT